MKNKIKSGDDFQRIRYDNQKISDNYFTPAKFGQTENGIIVYLYSFGAKGVCRPEDISDLIVDYSYECTCDNNVHQTAEITVKGDPKIRYIWTRWENRELRWRDSSGQGYGNIYDLLIAYRLIKTYKDPETGSIQKLDLGYFIMTGCDTAYGTTEESYKISLSGLSILLGGEYGGNVITAVNTYIFEKITYTDDTTSLRDVNKKEQSGTENKDKNSGNSSDKMNASNNSDKTDGSTDKKDSQSTLTDKTKPIKKIETVEYKCPMAITLKENQSIDPDLIYNLAVGLSSMYRTEITYQNQSHSIPVVWAVTGDGQRFWSIPYDVDFDVDIDRAGLISKVMEIGFEEGSTYWIDENRILHISSKAVKRGQLIAHWRDYSDLFVSESISFDNTGYYNTTDVFGKDNEYFARYEAPMAGQPDNVRKQNLSYDELMSNDGCRDRAEWETWKSMYGHMTTTVTLADKYIPQLINPSNRVGQPIEYMGTDGYISLYFLDKISYSQNKITLTLTVFKPMYLSEDIYLYGHDKAGNEMLDFPYITRHEILNGDTIRLYISGNDVEYGVVRLYEHNGFIKTSVHTDGSNKYVDFPITHNGTYLFEVGLYSPYFEDSGISGELTDGRKKWYEVTITDYVIPSPMEDPDPYPHPNIFVPENAHPPYIITSDGRKITAEDGGNITV